MFHLRSIRRKMAAGIAVGLVMLLALSTISMLGLRWYRGAVDSFDYAVNQAPRRASLTFALARLHDLLRVSPKTQAAHRIHSRRILHSLDAARAEVDNFISRMDDVPLNPGVLRRKKVAEQQLQFISHDLSRMTAGEKQRAALFAREPDVPALLDRIRALATGVSGNTEPTAALHAEVGCLTALMAEPVVGPDDVAELRIQSTECLERICSSIGTGEAAPDDPGSPDTAVSGLAELRREIDRFWMSRKREAFRVVMRDDVTRLMRRVDHMPDPYDVTVPADRARRNYRSLSQTVYIITGCALALFLGLVLIGIRSVFRPIRAVADGAARVAQGDFDYRLELDSRDEISQLADSFNKMTDRFLEKALDLEEQVEVRSRQLVRSERLAGVGFMAANVAHEINNPLQSVLVASDALNSRSDDELRQPSDDDLQQMRTYLSMIQRESARCRDITSRLLDFARGENAPVASADLVMIINEVLEMVSHMSRFRDRSIQFSPDRPVLVEVHAPQIKQVVLNLIANALEATDSGGRLAISIVERTDDVIVEFRDNGCGMPPDVIREVFEPFATHRRDGKGTGLGLCISERIVREHQGTLEAHSDGPGQGSVFRMRLPRAASQASAA